jgi:hypothetical protein
MRHSSGQSTTISSLLRCQDNIYEAINFWSADVCRPRKSDKLDKIDTWLKNNNYNPYELLIYITNYSAQDSHIESLRLLHKARKENGKGSEYLLIQHNAWTGKPEVLEGFADWKGRRDEELSVKYKIILEEFNRRRRILDIPTILERNFLKAGPVFTIDIACMFKEQHMDMTRGLINKYNPMTMLMLMGCPEYLDKCPTLAQVIEENVDGLSNLIFARDW